jgi:hypothetical protein
VPQSDGQNCHHLWIRFVTSLTFFFWVFVTVSFHITKTVTNVTNCDFVRSSHNLDGYRKLQKYFFSWLFCDYYRLCLFLHFTSVLNRLIYIGCCRKNYYQKHFCFWWSNITSLINFGSNSMLLMPNNGSFSTIH